MFRDERGHAHYAAILISVFAAWLALLGVGDSLKRALAGRTVADLSATPLVTSRAQGGLLGDVATITVRLGRNAAARIDAEALVYPLRSARVLDATAEEVKRVATARVLHADYDLLRADFRHLRRWSDQQVNAWLLDEAGFISAAQAEQAVVNAPVQSNGQVRRALRPPFYGRGLVFEVEGGLLEGKGFGSLDPQPGLHADGLALVAELIREWQFMDMVSALLEDAESPYSVIRPYALIDWGFDADRLGGGRAGAILRQAHKRYPSVFHAKSAHLVDDQHALAVERTLRRYGVTTTGAHRQADWLRSQNAALLNVQGDISQRRLVDFASWMVFDDSLEPRNLRNFWSGEVLANEADPNMLPDAARRVRTDRFFGPVSADFGVLSDPTWADARWLSGALSRGEIEPARLSEHLRLSRKWVRESIVRTP